MKQDRQEQLALQRYGANDLDGADSACVRWLRKQPANLVAWNLRGAIHFRQGHLQEAERLLTQALRIRKNADSHFNLGLVFNAQGRTDEAMSAYRHCLALADHAQASGNLANLLKAERRFDEAEALYRQAVRLDPDYGLAWSNLGRCCSRMAALSKPKPQCGRPSHCSTT